MIKVVMKSKVLWVVAGVVYNTHKAALEALSGSL